jgi:hypothetical protein
MDLTIRERKKFLSNYRYYYANNLTIPNLLQLHTLFVFFLNNQVFTMVFNVKSFYILSYLLLLIIKYDDLKKDSNLGYLSHLFHIKIPLYRLISFFQVEIW